MTKPEAILGIAVFYVLVPIGIILLAVIAIVLAPLQLLARIVRPA